MALKTWTVYYTLTTMQIICCQGSYYINTEESNWRDAQSKCTLATPDIDFHRSKYQFEIDDLEWKNAGSAWTGYYKVTMAFEYTGCAKLSDINELNPTEQDIDKDPSQCFPKCETTDIIGVTKDKCYCLKEPLPKSSIGHEACTEDCESPKGITCVGKKNKFVSIYTINPEVPTEPESSALRDTDDDKSCLSMKNGTGKWKECDKDCTCICRTINGTTAAHPAFLGTWSMATKLCFENQEYPIGYLDALSFSMNTDSKVWTGVFKMEIIFSPKWKGYGIVESKIKRYGFTKKDEQKYILDFTDGADDASNKQILCDSDGKGSTVPDSEELKKGTTIQPETSTGQHSLDTSMNSGTAFGICVVVVLILTAVIAAVVYLRKRYINSHSFDKMAESSVTGPDHEYNYPNYAFCRESEPNSPVGTTSTELSVRNNADGTEYNYPDFSIQNAENTSQYTYISETGNSAVVSNIKVNPYSYESAYKVKSNASDEDTSYNKTCGKNNINPKTQDIGGSKINNYDELGGNSYNVLGTHPTFETGITYATTPVQESSASATSIYDSSLPSSLKLKQSQGGFTDNIYVVNSDTYITLGSKTGQSKADQLYGMKQVEKFNHILKPGGIENIYNTISGQTKTTTVTDNPYAKLGH